MELPTLLKGRLKRRYKRFLADITLDSGEEIIAHCPNSGRMTGCAGEGWDVLVSTHNNPKRKLKYTLELIHNGTSWIVVNTNHANAVAFEAVTSNLFNDFDGCHDFKREVKYGENSRVDIFMYDGLKPCYVEVKSVTLIDNDGYNSFPDSPTVRGQKHLKELMNVVKKGERAVMLFVIMRNDGKGFRPAKDIDPLYATLLDEAINSGVECLIYQANITPKQITISSKLFDNIELTD